MRFIDPDHPFFSRPWVRWTTALAPIAWAGVELLTGNPGWAVVFGAAGVFAFWQLVIVGPSDK